MNHTTPQIQGDFSETLCKDMEELHSREEVRDLKQFSIKEALRRFKLTSNKRLAFSFLALQIIAFIFVLLNPSSPYFLALLATSVTATLIFSYFGWIQIFKKYKDIYTENLRLSYLQKLLK